MRSCLELWSLPIMKDVTRMEEKAEVNTFFREFFPEAGDTFIWIFHRSHSNSNYSVRYFSKNLTIKEERIVKTPNPNIPTLKLQ